MKPIANFYEIQKRERRKSLLLFIPLVIIYLLAVSLLSWPILVIFNPFQSFLPSLGVIIAVSLIIALVHWTAAVTHGTQTILNRLSARKPDPSDRYHKQYGHVVEEIRLASGIPAVQPFVIPSWVYNSMALVD